MNMALRIIKRLLLALIVLIVAAIAVVVATKKEAIQVGSNSVSRSLCAAAFTSHVDPDRMFREEQMPTMRVIAWAVRYDVDRERREVHTSVLGGFGSRAVYRDGLGCVLVHGDVTVPDAAGVKVAPIDPAFSAQVVEATDPAMRRALDMAFAEPNPAKPRLTKAVVVLHDGKLIAERYAAGYGPDTPIWGHSLSKSITQALVGVLVREGKLTVAQAAPLAAWNTSGDPRHTVTVDQLLRMTSGLPFDETDDPVNPMARMWFLQNDMAAFATQQTLAHAPGTSWAYSNVGYVLLSRIAMDAVGAHDAVAAERFIHDELFAPLGMRSAVIETDLAGTPIGSSHVYASARDFARFGQLYLDDGVAGGKRVLPEGWAAYSHSQTLDTGYGAGFWTNLVNQGSVPVWDAPWGIPQLPRDMYYARGAMGQYVIVIPSEHLVVARLGISVNTSTGIGDAVAEIIKALHAPGAH
jgi:CubicO group peptidase (beta-lactamase class C family)